MDFREQIVRKLQQTMAEKKLKGMLLFRPENSAYISGYFPRGFMSGPVVAVIPSEGDPTLVTNFYEEAFIKLFSWVKNLRVYESYRREAKVDPFAAAVKEVKNTLKEQRLSGGLLGTDDATQSLSDSLTEGKLVDISNILGEMRLTKSEEEINLVKEACHIADVGHETFLDNSQENTPEIEVRSRAQLAMYTEAFRRLQLGVRDAHMALVGAGLGSGSSPIRRSTKRASPKWFFPGFGPRVWGLSLWWVFLSPLFLPWSSGKFWRNITGLSLPPR